MIVIATAGSSIPRACARVFRGVEINSSFYRAHARSTYERWARQTPRSFRFAVKLPREITHDLRLRGTRRRLMSFLEEIAGLGRRLGPLVVQLPPSFVFDARVARTLRFRSGRCLESVADAPTRRMRRTALSDSTTRSVTTQSAVSIGTTSTLRREHI